MCPVFRREDDQVPAYGLPPQAAGDRTADAR